MSVILPTRFNHPHRLIQHYLNPASFLVSISNDIFFSASPDGTVFNYGRIGNAWGRPQSPAWDITTPDTGEDVYSDPTVVDRPKSFDVTDGGDRLFAAGPDNAGTPTQWVAGYTLSPRNDISSWALQGKIKVQDIDSWIAGNRRLNYLKVSPDGKKMICQDDTSKRYNQFEFQTAWDVTSLKWNGVWKNVANPGISFIPFNGRYLFTWAADGKMYQYYMSQAWELSSLGDSISNNTLTGVTTMRGFHVDDYKLTLYDATNLWQFYYTAP